MKFLTKHLTLTLKLTLAAGLLSPALLCGQSTGFTEPPVSLFGKVIQYSGGTPYQMHDGGMEITLVNEADPSDVVILSTTLGSVGAGGTFSYALDVPRSYLPSADQAGSVLAVSASGASYRFASVIIEGVEASPLDSGQSLLSVNFSNRDGEHRLDLLVSLPQSDSDGDGMPDWWEEQNGLNPLFADDASDDADGDGLNNRDEFLAGSDPNRSNSEPIVATTQIPVPLGGVAGLFLRVIDVDSPPAQLVFDPVTVPAGITLETSAGPLVGSFTYADLLAGDLTIAAADSYVEAALILSLEDLAAPVPLAAQQVSVVLDPFSPGTGNAPTPTLWLDAGTLAAGAVAEWGDRSGNLRDAYQPVVGEQPDLLSGTDLMVDFDGGEFFYVDDRGFTPSEFTSFFAFRPDTLSSDSQVIFNGLGLQLAVAGEGDPQRAQTLVVNAGAQEIQGPVLALGELVQTTVRGNPAGFSLGVRGESLHYSYPNTASSPPAFPTIGALRSALDPFASNWFDGRVGEILLYASELDELTQARVEDYQFSRWSGLVVWDQRSETSPITLRGQSGRRNILNGGWGGDTLAGAELSDILRSGPGDDRMTGGASADRFQVFPGQGDETLTDFSEPEGDILDLTAILGGRGGSPTDYLNFQLEFVRPPGGLPTVNSILEIDHDGDGSGADQTVTFEGLTLTTADLPRLVGAGRIQTGGPQFEVGLELDAAETQLVETELPRSLTLTRNGNLDASLTVHLSFTGTADAAIDYSLTNTNGSGIVRSVTFAAGQTSRTIDLTPIQDQLDESETILVAILPLDLVTSLPEVPLTLSLDDAPEITLTALQPYAQRAGQVPAILELRRAGPLDAALDLGLNFAGEAVNGRDYESLPNGLTIPAGVAAVQLELTPLASSPLNERPIDALLAVLEDKTRFYVDDDAQATATILDAYDGTLRTFQDFVDNYFPGQDPGTVAVSDTDGDSLIALFEYLGGSDPTVDDREVSDELRIFRKEDDHIEIQIDEQVGLSDLQIGLEVSQDLFTYRPTGDDFDLRYEQLPDGRIRRVYTSRLDLSELPARQFFRLDLSLLP